MKAISPVVTIDDLGIHLSATWFRKAESIPWKQILAIAEDKRGSTKICYVSEGGKVRRVVLGENKQTLTRAVDQWRQSLITEFAANQELTGSYVHSFSAWDRYARLFFMLISIGVCGHYLSRVVTMAMLWNRLHYGCPELQQLSKWVAFYGIAPMCVPFLGVCIAWGMIVFHTIRLTRWRSWKLTSHGFLRRNNYGQWETFALGAGDRICPDALVIGGETLPLWRPAIGGLTYNAALPHLLALLARQHNIVPSPGRRKFPLGIAVRFAVFWPIVILGLWYAPLLMWEVPDGLDLTVRLNLCLVLGSCGIASVGFLIAGILEAPRHRARFSKFLVEVEEFQQRLQWGAPG